MMNLTKWVKTVAIVAGITMPLLVFGPKDIDKPNQGGRRVKLAEVKPVEKPAAGEATPTAGGAAPGGAAPGGAAPTPRRGGGAIPGVGTENNTLIQSFDTQEADKNSQLDQETGKAEQNQQTETREGAGIGEGGVPPPQLDTTAIGGGSPLE